MEIKSLHILTDEQLIKMAHEGSTTAEEILIEKYRHLAKIKSKEYFIVGADQDDVIQEGMIGLYKAVKAFDPEGKASFKTFADTCITNQILSAIKTANTKKNIPLNESVPLNAQDDGEGELAEFIAASEEGEPEAQALTSEILRALAGSSESPFSEMEIQVIQLRLQGYDYAEIAENLGKSTKSIDNAIQRVKKKIVAYLEK